ncbi:MAG: magnesium transporter [Alphaproteobacteria bacterium]
MNNPEQRPDGNIPPPPPTEADGDAFDALYGLSEQDLDRLSAILNEDPPNSDALNEFIAPIHAADLADIIEQLDRDQRIKLLQVLGADIDSEAISHLNYSLRLKLLRHVPLQTLAILVKDLESDDAIDIIEDLSEEEQENLLRLVPSQDRAVYELGLSFPEDSAGRLMRRELVTIPNFWTVGQSIDYLRGKAQSNIPEDFYSLVVVGPQHKPVGLVRLAKLLTSTRVTAIAAIMERELKLIPVDMDQEDVAFLFKQYGLVETPVIDQQGRLVGSITIDDIVDVIQEEHEEDMLSMAGVRHDDFYADVIKTTGARLSWLVINLITAIAASLVIGLFEGALTQLVALSVLMPIVASMGGNAGTQTLTVAVRALATNELTAANASAIVVKEGLVGGLNGIIFALLIGCVAWGWYGNMALGIVIAAAMIINLLMAGVAGVAIPVILDRFGRDPAISSAVFLTTVTDIVGFLSFLGLATLILL